METLLARPCSSRPASRLLRRGEAAKFWTPHTRTSNWRRATLFCSVQLAQVSVVSTVSLTTYCLITRGAVCVSSVLFYLFILMRFVTQEKPFWRRRWPVVWMSRLPFVIAPLSLRLDMWGKTSSPSSPNCCKTPTTLWKRLSKVKKLITFLKSVFFCSLFICGCWLKRNKQ